RRINQERLCRSGAFVQELQQAGREVTRSSNLMAITLVRHATGSSLNEISRVAEDDYHDDDDDNSDQSPQELIALSVTLFNDADQNDDCACVEKEVGPLHGAITRDIVSSLMRFN
ncbi:hypothetical protein V8E36_008439, partial [Tilletia maclaganii]